MLICKRNDFVSCHTESSACIKSFCLPNTVAERCNDALRVSDSRVYISVQLRYCVTFASIC